MTGFSLHGRTALVTGAGRGLGLAMATAMAEAGARVILNGRNARILEEAALALRSGVRAAEIAVFDIAHETEREAGLDALARRGLGADILVNNVGQRHRGPLADCSPADLRNLLEADLVAPFSLTRSLAPAMAERGFGRIINICSIAGPRARANDAAYTAAKGGLAALTRALAVELGPTGITCNGIAPGFFMTETNEPMSRDPEVGRFVAERIPLGRWGEPREIAGAAVFLASDAASYVNGHVLTVDGGLSVSF
jgi:gluconate 5-dehydrogenase